MYLPSYLQDTARFLHKINNAGKVSDDTFMVTIAVKSIHQHDNNEELRVVEERLEKRTTKNTPSYAITLLIKLILMLNNFVFNGVSYLQKKGVAMGIRPAISFTNVFMGYFEDKFVYKSRWLKRFIKSLWRYIDDIFML